ncbi:uncharacterized protein DUF4160 [Desulfobotulus alkaliphilus]|uniref:Uncharacterized protein DUF4160 n=2 Tax=Desulfobotulus alkaliphilus TaxID=622671 RepID=A0A562RDV3_9BACT|nr:uncharacterized protein DUF4160 [Desulfobotulus alkaliphilus]
MSAAKIKVSLAEGSDPGGKKKKVSTEMDPAESFQALAMEWYEKVHATQVVEAHAVRNLSRLKKMVFPYVGEHRPNEITPPMVLDLLLKICDTGHIETAHRAKSVMSLVFRYGISLGRAERDPTRDLSGMLPAPHFHAYYAEHRATVDISTCEILDGSLPKIQKKQVLAWAEIHQEALIVPLPRLWCFW